MKGDTNIDFQDLQMAAGAFTAEDHKDYQQWQDEVNDGESDPVCREILEQGDDPDW